jgi:hypothetical protein
MITMKNKIIALAVVGSLVSCEEQLELEQCCCDCLAANFEIEYNGYNVNQLYFTNSDICNNNLCVYY